jgi:hypothetical protein
VTQVISPNLTGNGSGFAVIWGGSWWRRVVPGDPAAMAAAWTLRGSCGIGEGPEKVGRLALPFDGYAVTL